MSRLGLAALAAFLLAAPSASAASVYRDADAGVEVRISRGIATVRFHDPTCGAGVYRTRVRNDRLSRLQQFGCDPGGVTSGRWLRLSARVTPLRVFGHIEGRRFVARRNARKPTAAQRCAHRGLTLAESEAVRVFRDGNLTIACRRRDGAGSVIGRYEPDEDDYYASGTSAWSITAIGSRIAFAQAPFSTAASKYGGGDHPMFDPSVIVRDLETGAVSRVDPELKNVQKVALHPDGRVAWAGTDSHYYAGDTLVMTVQDGKVVTLDRGRIDAQSLRAEADGFAWDKAR